MDFQETPQPERGAVDSDEKPAHLVLKKRDQIDTGYSVEGVRSMSMHDKRQIQDKKQIIGLHEAFQKHSVQEALGEIDNFLGNYSSGNLDVLEVHIVDGQLGNGQVLKGEDQKGNVMELELPSPQSILEDARENIGKMGINITETQLPSFAEEVGNAIVAQVAIHEGAHGLLDSTPNSQFAQDFEEILGIENEKGEIATLLDEGIAHAVGDIFAPRLDYDIPFESNEEHAQTEIQRQRIVLGKQLRPMIEKYLQEGKQIDKEFMKYAATEMRNLLEES